MALTEADIARKLYFGATFQHGDRAIHFVFLLRDSLWRPLRASWWRGKEVSIIGGDESGNYILRHSDGSVRFWDHARGHDEILAPSVREFLSRLGRSAH